MTWREYHELTKHSVESLRRTQRYLDWANMPNPFRHYEGVPILELPADPPSPQKAVPKKASVKTKVGGKKTTVGKTADAIKKQVREKSQSVHTTAFALERLGSRSGEQSGDLQGLSNVQGADSESVDELLEQGNAFEADVVKGVEDAGDADEGEVRSHEVPQDNVPGKYLDKKQ
jgi:hypothetical protein